MSGINFSIQPDQHAKTSFHEWFNDFDIYLATDWVITETGSGSRAIAQAKDGILVVTTGTATADLNSIQARDVASGQVAEHWVFTTGKHLYFGARFKLSEVTLSDFVMGLQITDTTPLAVSDGIWFQSDAGDAFLDFHVAASSVQSDLTAAASLAAGVYTTVEMYYDAAAAVITCLKDGVAIGSLPVTNAPSHTLCVSFGVKNGLTTTTATVLSIDWIRVMQGRDSP